MYKILTMLTAGIIIGILIAPDSGTATRRKLAELVSDTTDDAEDFIDETAELLENKLARTKSRFENA